MKDEEDYLMYSEIAEMKRLEGELTGLAVGMQHIARQIREIDDNGFSSNEAIWDSKINMEKALADIRQWEVQRAINAGTAK